MGNGDAEFFPSRETGRDPQRTRAVGRSKCDLFASGSIVSVSFSLLLENELLFESRYGPDARDATDDASARIYDQLIEGHRHKHYSLKEGFLMMHGRLCVTHQLRQNIVTKSRAPPYAGHRGID